MTLNPEQLHVIRCYERLPPQPGGMEQHIAALTAAQRRQGVRVTEVFNTGLPAGESVQVLPGWQVDKIRPGMLRAAIFYAGVATKRIDVSDGRLRVLHVHGDWPAFMLAGAVGRKLRVNALAASLHDRARGPLARYDRVLRPFCPVFTTGFSESRRLAKRLGRPVIHLPSAPANLFFENPHGLADPVDVVAVGSLVQKKNLDALLLCAALRRHLQFAILGEGPERARLDQMRARLGLDNVTFRGAVSREEVHSALCSARLFISTSHNEGSPTAALEAMACGLPVVLAPSNDYSAIIEQGANGIVTATWDAEELARAIDGFLDHPERLPEARALSRQTAQEHRWDRKAQLVTEAFLTALERKIKN